MEYKEYKNTLIHILQNYIDGFWTKDETIWQIAELNKGRETLAAQFTMDVLMEGEWN
jgi:hypothetical protein